MDPHGLVRHALHWHVVQVHLAVPPVVSPVVSPWFPPWFQWFTFCQQRYPTIPRLGHLGLVVGAIQSKISCLVWGPHDIASVKNRGAWQLRIYYICFFAGSV